MLPFQRGLGLKMSSSICMVLRKSYCVRSRTCLESAKEVSGNSWAGKTTSVVTRRPTVLEFGFIYIYII